ACPEFVAQDTLSFDAGARRYEPGALNLAGICGMGASLRLLLDCGVEAVGTRILELRRYFVERLRARGYQLYLDEWDRRAAASDAERSGIITVQRPGTDMKAVFVRLKTSGVTASLRRNRAGATMIRFSPHFYNTEEEFERAVAMM
ncbi:MAG: aminotransferase class V-fold PLP-dependent enzyme, partial [Candidatus Hydrogenedentes bacterium]|nr:aminotransferase class V-fold PLP-dependent enzyme [Candidatus Hydrogenedentota bacterium]